MKLKYVFLKVFSVVIVLTVFTGILMIEIQSAELTAVGITVIIIRPKGMVVDPANLIND